MRPRRLPSRTARVLVLALLLAGRAAAAAEPPGARAAAPVPGEYERCVGLLRHDPEGARARAAAWEAAGGGDAARQCGALADLALGDPGRAAERLDRVAASSAADPEARAAVYAQATQAWLMAEDPGRAYASATLALLLRPDDADLLIDRSVAAAIQGRYEDTVADLDRAVDLDPRRADAWTFRAAAWRHLGQPALAADDAARALAIDPAHPEALLERGLLRRAAGDAAGARADWRRVVAAAPDGPAADLARRNLEAGEPAPRPRRRQDGGRREPGR